MHQRLHHEHCWHPSLTSLRVSRDCVLHLGYRKLSRIFLTEHGQTRLVAFTTSAPITGIACSDRESIRSAMTPTGHASAFAAIFHRSHARYPFERLFGPYHCALSSLPWDLVRPIVNLFIHHHCRHLTPTILTLRLASVATGRTPPPNGAQVHAVVDYHSFTCTCDFPANALAVLVFCAA